MRTAFVTTILFALLIPTHSVQGQGTFEMSNVNFVYGVDAPVSDANGNLLGTNYLALLFGGASTNSMQALQPPVPFEIGIGAGYFYNQSPNGWRVVPGVPGGTYAWLQVVAWDARLGASYEDVVSLGIGGYGQSLLFFAQSGGAGVVLLTPPAPLIGLQSFSLLPIVPESSTALLLLLGLPLLLWRRHFRK